MIEKTREGIIREYERALGYDEQIGLFETVKTSENFFLGRQWEGVFAPDIRRWRFRRAPG